MGALLDALRVYLDKVQWVVVVDGGLFRVSGVVLWLCAAASRVAVAAALQRLQRMGRCNPQDTTFVVLCVALQGVVGGVLASEFQNMPTAAQLVYAGGMATLLAHLLPVERPSGPPKTAELNDAAGLLVPFPDPHTSVVLVAHVVSATCFHGIADAATAQYRFPTAALYYHDSGAELRAGDVVQVVQQRRCATRVLVDAVRTEFDAPHKTVRIASLPVHFYLQGVLPGGESADVPAACFAHVLSVTAVEYVEQNGGAAARAARTLELATDAWKWPLAGIAVSLWDDAATSLDVAAGDAVLLARVVAERDPTEAAPPRLHLVGPGVVLKNPPQVHENQYDNLRVAARNAQWWRGTPPGREPLRGAAAALMGPD